MTPGLATVGSIPHTALLQLVQDYTTCSAYSSWSGTCTAHGTCGHHVQHGSQTGWSRDCVQPLSESARGWALCATQFLKQPEWALWVAHVRGLACGAGPGQFRPGSTMGHMFDTPGLAQEPFLHSNIERACPELSTPYSFFNAGSSFHRFRKFWFRGWTLHSMPNDQPFLHEFV